MDQRILPNGSVVRLEGDEGYIMVCGRLVVSEDAEGRDVMFDYAGCAFPTGIVGEDVFLFNSEDIEEILFIGFQDARELSFQKKLENYVKELAEKN